jgi:hypothetical protein
MVDMTPSKQALEEVRLILKSIIERERKNGCPMASEDLIEPALRRWASYERRNKRNKSQTLEHRALDLKKGLLALFPDHGYDESCLTHLAQSFALVLSHESGDMAVEACHKPAMPTDSKPSSCQVHGTSMKERAVRIQYGLIRGTPKVAPAYLDARKTGFPNCDDVVLGGCVLREPKTRRKLICPDCNAARDSWLSEHNPTWVAKNTPSGL